MPLDEPGLGRLLKTQDGVVSRRQVLALGGSPAAIRRRLRRREWATVHHGTYVDHTGPLTRRQREWAAVLACWPAALHRETALEAHGFERDWRRSADTVHVMVDAARSVTSRQGIRVERVTGAAAWVAPQARPPRARVEFAAVKVAAGRPDDGAIAVLADVCRQGLTTPDRLLAVVRRLPRLPRRALLETILADVASGTHSVLEQRYLAQVERAHGLLRGRRQVPVASGGTVHYRDVRYDAHRTLVELDGRFGHTDTEDRWDDLDRDVAAAVAGDITIRLGWRQVLAPCRVAAALEAILRARGWTGRAVGCGRGCLLLGRGESVPRADPEPPRTIRRA